MSKQFLDRNLAGKIQNLTKGEKFVKKYVYILAEQRRCHFKIWRTFGLKVSKF